MTNDPLHNIAEYPLIGGPHDGAKIIGGKIPQTIYLNGVVNADEFSTWVVKKSNRYKYCYVLDGFKYKFERKKSYDS